MIRCNICGYILDSYDYNCNCPLCKATDWYDYYLSEIKKINSDESFVNAMIELREKNPIEFQIKIKQLGIQTLADIQKENMAHKQQEVSNVPRCPKCGSTSITTGARGVNFTWGLLGASKTVNRCSNCGHTWKPKK